MMQVSSNYPNVACTVFQMFSPSCIDTPEFRFLRSLYVVDESSESTVVCATIDAQLQRNFTVLIQTEENTATGR